MSKPQSTIKTGTKYYTWLTPHHTSNFVTHINRTNNIGTSNSHVPNKDSETIRQYSWSPYLRNVLLIYQLAFKEKDFSAVQIINLILSDQKLLMP